MNKNEEKYIECATSNCYETETQVFEHLGSNYDVTKKIDGLKPVDWAIREMENERRIK